MQHFVVCRERLDPTEIHKVKGRMEVLEAKCERLENDLADARLANVV